MVKQIEFDAMLIVGEKQIVIDDPLVVLLDAKTKEVKEILKCQKEDSK